MKSTTAATKCIFSVDVEDWFHILDLPSTPGVREWDALPSRVETNFRTMLDLLRERDIRSTCFFLGWVAEKYPHLVREASEQGHEIASHGCSHKLIYHMTPAEFSKDIRRSKDVLENITGKAVLGYRAPGFSLTEATPWFFERLAEAGYRYDSSVFPARRGHGGMPDAPSLPYEVKIGASTGLIEFPISVVEIFSRTLCLFGGGYLRLAPWWLIKTSAARLIKQDQPVIFYVHPREIDCDHPRLPMGKMRAFKSYVNLKSTQPKIERILKHFQPITFQSFLEQRWPEFAVGEVEKRAAVKVQHASAGD